MHCKELRRSVLVREDAGEKLGVVEEFGGSEVAEDHLHLLVDENVLQLQISVENSIAGKVGKRGKDVLHQEELQGETLLSDRFNEGQGLAEGVEFSDIVHDLVPHSPGFQTAFEVEVLESGDCLGVLVGTQESDFVEKVFEAEIRGVLFEDFHGEELFFALVVSQLDLAEFPLFESNEK